MKKTNIQKTLSTLAILGTLGLTLSTPALARGPKADKDGDGVVSKSEFMEKAQVRFTRQDTDGNGVITKEEVTVKAEEKFNKLDSNQDGVLSSDEFRQHRRQRSPQPNS